MGEGGQAGEGEARQQGEESLFRAVAARGNYLWPGSFGHALRGEGGVKVQLKPEEQDWRSEERLARYFDDDKKVVIEHKHQKQPEKVIARSHTDVAGCRRTRRSTSGGEVMFGKQCIKTYSQTQETVALSSGESEFYGIAMAATMGLGMKGVTADLGLEVKVQVIKDSRAAKSIAKRSGESEAHRGAGVAFAGPRCKRRVGDQEGERRGERCRRIDQTRGACEDGLLREGVRARAEER